MDRILVCRASLGLAIAAASLAPFACSASSSKGPAAAPDSGIPDATVIAADAHVPGDASSGDATDAPLANMCTATPCVTALAAGGTHTCARLQDGSLRCWGSNLSGELGIGTVIDGGFDGGLYPAPVQPPVQNAIGAAAGGQGQTQDFTCARLEGGTVSCWGSNYAGQIARSFDGGNDPQAHPDPQNVGGLTNVLDVRCGGAHTCALLDGGVACWGQNAQAQLARPDAGLVATAPGLTALAAGSVPRQIANGQFHTCALLSDGTVWCWGENGSGQLGRSLDGSVQDPIPGPVVGLSQVAEIALGNFHSCARLSDGLLLCWGQNDHGQTGRGPGGATDEPSPGLVALPAGSQVADVSAGLLHTCAVLTDGTVWCWGANATGATAAGAEPDGGFSGVDVDTPVQVEGLSGPATAVAAGYLHTCALLVGGSVMCWGSNQFGELGGGPSDAAAPNSFPHPIPSAVVF